MILILAISVPAFAAGDATVACVAKGEVKRGETVTVTVTMNNCGAFKSMAITPSYDKNIFDMLSGEWLITGAMLADFNGTNAAIAYSTEVTKSGDVFRFVLVAKEDAAVGNTTVKANAVVKNGNTSVPVTATTKTIKITCKTHTFGAWSVTGNATCTTKGAEKRTCSTCGETESKSIAAIGHKMTAWSQTKAPTCTAKGEEKRTCTNSGCKHSETRAINALGHNFGGWKVTKAATCTAKGTQSRTCSKCNSVETKAVEMISHEFETPVVVKEATISVAGLMQGKCKNCGKTTDQVIPCGATDATTGIKVATTEGVFTEGTTTDFAVSSGDANVQNALINKSGYFTAYKIAFKNNGAAASVNGEYTLTIPANSNIQGENVIVYYIGSDNVAVEQEFALNSDGTVSVTTSDTGVFAVADKSVTVKTGDADVDKDSVADPEEGNNSFTIIAAIVTLIIIAIIIVILIFAKKRKNKVSSLN